MALDKVTLDRLNLAIEQAKDLAAYNAAMAAKQAYLLSQEEEAKKGKVAPRGGDDFDFEFENDDEPKSSYVESTEQQESKQNTDQLSQSERRLVDQMLADIEKISDKHDEKMRAFLKPPVSPAADDALSGKTSIRDVEDEDVVSRYNQNMNLLRPQPTATVESEEEITATPAAKKAPETIVGDALRINREQRFMLAAAMLRQNFTPADIVALNQIFTQFSNDVSSSLNQSMTASNISSDRRTLLLTHVMADLLESRPAATRKPTGLPQFGIHTEAADAGLTQTGSNLPKPQYGGKKAEEELPAQPGVVPFKPQKPGPGYNAR